MIYFIIFWLLCGIINIFLYIKYELKLKDEVNLCDAFPIVPLFLLGLISSILIIIAKSDEIIIYKKKKHD